MSGKGKTALKATPSTGSSGGIRSSARDAGSSPHGARERSTSPTVISRTEEKNQLASLNDRLAVYIDRVRRLETENDRLTKITHDIEETTRSQVNSVKGLYDAELAEARRLLDQLAKEKAKFQLEVGRLQSQVQDLQTKLTGKERSETDLKQRLIAAEAQIGDLQARVNDSANQKRRLEDEIGRLSRELDAANKQVAAARKDLEAETIRRVDLENRNKSLQEQLTFQAQLHRKEIEETSSRRRIEIDQVDGRLQQEYDSKLAESLQQMREENDELIRRNREEFEAAYEAKMADCQAAMLKCQEVAHKAQSELRQLQKRCEELTSENSKLSAQASANTSRLETLERLLQRERVEHQDALAAKDAEIRQLKKTLEDQLAEYRDLLEVKIQLDAEIATYRKLLEMEETRLNLSSPGPPSSTKRSTPAVDGSGSRKRRIVESEEISSSYISDQHSAVGKVGVEIHSVDPDGKYVRLFNNTDKSINVTGWTLKQKGGDAEVTFKFPQRSQIKPHQVLTIWSSDVSPSHGPTELTMKSQTWLSTDSIHTLLMDAKGEEVASRESRFGTRNTSPSTSASGSVDSHDSGFERGSRSQSSWGFGSLFTVFI